MDVYFHEYNYHDSLEARLREGMGDSLTVSRKSNNKDVDKNSTLVKGDQLCDEG